MECKDVRAVVAIPVRDEAERIGACIAALAHQNGTPTPALVLLLNNCNDATGAVVERERESYPADLHAVSVTLPSASANAGTARGLAMEFAAARMTPDQVLLTTDADGTVGPSWVAQNVKAIAEGADAVFGRATIHPVEARLIPQTLHDDDARECRYAALLDEIVCLLDPDPADPWPRHTEESGASIALPLKILRAIGGLPRQPSGEDRALGDRLRRWDAKLRHDPEIEVVVSGRIHGRAEGGMADTILRRMAAPDPFLDDRLEPARDAARRATLRAELRRLHCSGGTPSLLLAQALQLEPFWLKATLLQPYFGAAWADIEALSPALVRHRVASTDVLRQTTIARDLLSRITRKSVPATAS